MRPIAISVAVSSPSPSTPARRTISSTTVGLPTASQSTAARLTASFAEVTRRRRTCPPHRLCPKRPPRQASPAELHRDADLTLAQLGMGGAVEEVTAAHRTPAERDPSAPTRTLPCRLTRLLHPQSAGNDARIVAARLALSRNDLVAAGPVRTAFRLPLDVCRIRLTEDLGDLRLCIQSK